MSYSDLKTVIENNLEKVASGIYLHSSTYYEIDDVETEKTAVRSGWTSTMVLGEPCAANVIKRRLAKARKIAMDLGKMVSATVLIVDKGFYDNNFAEFKQIMSEDGRIFGMTMKLTKKPGLLPEVSFCTETHEFVPAAFTIQDPKEVGAGDGVRASDTGASRSTGVVASSGLIDAIKKYDDSGKLEGAFAGVAEAAAAAAASAARATSAALSELRAGRGDGSGVSADELGSVLLRALIKEGWKPPEAFTMKCSVISDIDMEEYEKKSELAKDCVLWCMGEALKSVDGEARVKDVLTGIKAELGTCDDAVDFDF